MVNPLTTAEGILEWTKSHPHRPHDGGSGPVRYQTAEYLAECVRLRLAFSVAEDEMEALPLNDARKDYGDSIYNHAKHWLRPLRKAIAGENK